MSGNTLQDLGWNVTDYTSMDEDPYHPPQLTCYDTAGNVGITLTSTRENEYIECGNPVEVEP